MKGINTITAANDPGQDGITPATGINLNDKFGTDVAAFGLQYFNGDYVAINGQTPMASVNNSSNPASNSSALYNGNIRYMQTRLTHPTTGATMPMLNAYKYDQLNRLVESRSYESGLSSNVWNPTSYGNAYYNSFSYDAMGNITNQIRYSRSGTLIDNLNYSYQTNNGKLVRNRLYHLNDAQTNSSAFTDDIDNMLTFRPEANRINVNNNYNYDEEGRLVKDSTEKISKIVWRVDGKVKEIQRNGGTAKWLRFDYDAMGHRIAKHVYNNTGTTLERSTYYVLDAQGNQISTYDYEVVGGTAQYNLKERHIFGSSRLGMRNDSLNMLTATLNPYKYTRTLGWKYYEFSNHLGNVLAVYCDIKVPKDANANNVVDGFAVCIRNISDYSPFGVSLDGRTIQNDFYRHGFNGMEKDDELKGGGNSYDFGARMYDSRVGRWLTIDPLTNKLVSYSPYVFCLNNSLLFFDPNGKFPFPIHIRSFAPFEKFGGGFDGDGEDRGYTTSLSATSRISQKMIVDASEGKCNGLKTWCDPSSHPVLGKATEKPIGEISNFKTSGGSKGEKVITFTASYSGANPLIPASPDIDVSTNFEITENEKAGYLKINVTQIGDRFPAAETFITDSKGNSVFIGVSPFEGNPYTSLPGDNKRKMMTSNITISFDKKGVFTSVTSGGIDYSLSEWNDKMRSSPLSVDESSDFEFGGGSFGGAGSGGTWK